MSKYPCTVCKKLFKQSSYLKLHIQNHKGIRNYECEICDRAFVTGGDLKRHMSVHCDKKRFTCPYCSNEFTLKGNMDKHINAIHLNKRNFSCDLCSKSFSQKVHLKNHLDKHHSGNFAFTCPHCEKGFNLQNRLEIHILMHGKKLFKCQHCGILTSDQASLEKHETRCSVSNISDTSTQLKPNECVTDSSHFDEIGSAANGSEPLVGEIKAEIDEIEFDPSFFVEVKTETDEIT